MTHRLKFTSPSSDGMGKFHSKTGPFYFVATGDAWPHRPELRLISATTSDPAKARTFATIAEAMEVMTVCGEPDGWALEVVEDAP